MSEKNAFRPEIQAPEGRWAVDTRKIDRNYYHQNQEAKGKINQETREGIDEMRKNEILSFADVQSVADFARYIEKRGEQNLAQCEELIWLDNTWKIVFLTYLGTSVELWKWITQILKTWEWTAQTVINFQDMSVKDSEDLGKILSALGWVWIDVLNVASIVPWIWVLVKRTWLTLQRIWNLLEKIPKPTKFPKILWNEVGAVWFDIRNLLKRDALKKFNIPKEVFKNRTLWPTEDFSVENFQNFSFNIKYIGDDWVQYTVPVVKSSWLWRGRPFLNPEVWEYIEIGDFMHLPNTTGIAIKSDWVGWIKILNWPKTIKISQFEWVRNEWQSFLKKEVPINKAINSWVREKSVNRILSGSGEVFENSKIKGAGNTFANIKKPGRINEDRMFIDSEKWIMVSLDWMWWHGSWDKAASILANAIKQYPDDINYAIKVAWKEIGAQRLWKAWTCFTYSKLSEVNWKKYVDFYWAGDTKGVVISKSGIIKGETKDQSFVQMLVDDWHLSQKGVGSHPRRNEVTNYVWEKWLSDPNLLWYQRIEVQPWDRIFVYSDWISDNLTISEISKIIWSETEWTSIISKITEVVKNRKLNDWFLSNPKSDDISIWVFVVK